MGHEWAGWLRREANQLVEEFMLLANIRVARIISSAFPGQALLRRHPEPDPRKLAAAAAAAKDVVGRLSPSNRCPLS